MGSDLLWIRLRTLLWFLAFPLSFLGWLPWWLSLRVDGPFLWRGSMGQWVGLWLILDGLGLVGWCIQLFNVKGRGTPLPLDPPKQFVATGPYRFVRNPMMLGFFLLLAGEAALLGSVVVALYLLLAMGLAHLLVVFVEEPGLAKRFGSSYTAYARQVPRWVPRSFFGAPPTKTR